MNSETGSRLQTTEYLVNTASRERYGKPDRLKGRLTEM